MKDNDQAFADWESAAFGFGYGSGEEHIIQALHAFFSGIPETGAYDYKVLEHSLGAAVCWLLINALCRVDVIEYGSSPRFGWLTEHGKRLRTYILSKTPDDLGGVLNREVECGLGYCNCAENAPTDGPCKANPFFGRLGALR